LPASFPHALALGHFRHKGNPTAVGCGAIPRIKRHHAARAFVAGEIVILGVRSKRIGLVAALGQGHREAGADKENRVVEGQGGRDAGAAGRKKITHDGGKLHVA
jgi:hypothetical protein